MRLGLEIDRSTARLIQQYFQGAARSLRDAADAGGTSFNTPDALRKQADEYADIAAEVGRQLSEDESARYLGPNEHSVRAELL